MGLDLLDIENSLFYPAAGTDIQCILRFSHLAPTIIAPTVSPFLTLEKYVELFTVKCRTLNNHFGEEMLVLDSIEENPSLNISNTMEFPKGIFSEGEKKNYMHVFGRYINSNPHVYRFTFTRKTGSLYRKVEWVALATEGLATLLSIHNLTGKSPRIICTIQSGILEYPDSMFVRLINKINIGTRIWARGFWPCFDKSRDVISSFDPFSVCIQNFGHWNSVMGVEPQPNEENPCIPPLSYVRAFTNDPKFMNSIPKERVLMHPSNLNRMIRLKQKSILDEERVHDLIITSNRIIKGDGKKVLNWEDLSKREPTPLFPCLTFKESLDKAVAEAEKRNSKSVAVTPIGYEDEQDYLYELLYENDNNLNLTIYYQQPLDFYPKAVR